MTPAFIDQIIVKGQPGFIGNFLIPIGEDAAPGDGKAKYPEAHLGKQGDVSFVPMIEIDALQFQIVFGRMIRDRTNDPFWGKILGAPSFAIFIICALALVGGDCASP